jgi:hypothetical protein
MDSWFPKVARRVKLETWMHTSRTAYRKPPTGNSFHFKIAMAAIDDALLHWHERRSVD